MSAVPLDLAFPHDYEVALVDEGPPRGSVIRQVYFPGSTEAGGKDGLLVQVTPRDGAPWLGCFAFGSRGRVKSGVYSCPDPGSVCVVSRGAGYVVRAAEPSVWEEVECFPVTDVRAVVPAGLLVFADYTGLTAYGSKGWVWKTSRLSWDGLRIVKVTPETVAGLAWDAPDEREVEFVVDLRTGRHQGGSSPEAPASADRG